MWQSIWNLADKSIMFLLKKDSPVVPGSVVGTVHSRASLAAALRLASGRVDFLEVRVDAFAEEREAARLEKSLSRLPAPLIVTVRHPLEGGAGCLGVARRRALFQRFLPYASLVDVELRSAQALGDVLSAARTRGRGVILSHHDFRRTPSLARLQTLRGKAARAGCSIFKVAAMANTPHDAARLLDFLTHRGSGQPSLAVMGMGAYGKMSRLALGNAGSVLNYGYLDRPQVSGQWPAVLLKERLRELA